MITIAAAVSGAALALAGCTSSGGGAPSSGPVSTNYTTVTQTKPAPTPTVTTPKPIGAGPTTAATASACALLPTQTAFDRGGMRLGRIATLRSAGKVVGCRFYGQQQPNDQCGATCLANEHLPPGNQPVIEITTARYSSAKDAHNAFVLIANKGSNFQQVDIGIDNVGVCYQTPFYAKDKGKDWACGFSSGKTAVVIKTVASSASTRALAVEVAHKL